MPIWFNDIIPVPALSTEMLLAFMRILHYDKDVHMKGGDGMSETRKPFFNGYSAMGNGRTDYEAFYGITPSLLYRGSHCHDFYEFYIHFHGGQQMGFDNDFFSLEPCQLFIFPPFSMHGLVCMTEALDYERAYLYCSAETLRRAGCGQIDLDHAFRSAIAAKGNMFMLTKKDAALCKRCIRKIAANGDAASPETAFDNYAQILSLLTCALQAVRRKTAGMASHVTPSPMQQVITYINQHYTEPLRLQDVAARFSISQSSLSHEFVRYTNRGVYDYILYRRIMLARQLILSGQPFGEVSEQCGFSDYSNFLRAFHKHVGMSPREYLQTSHQA